MAKFQTVKPRRLKNHDYSAPGFYFITACTAQKRCVLGKIEDHRVILSSVGLIAKQSWMALPEHFRGLDLDEFVVMPNHIHGILASKNPVCISNVVGGFKARVTRLARENGLHGGDPLWQLSFYDHVIRDEHSLQAIRQYIVDNPVQWQVDSLNPSLQAAQVPHLR